MEHPMSSVNKLKLESYYVNNEEGIIGIYRLLGRDWQSMEEWLNKHGAVETKGMYAIPGEGLLGFLYTEKTKIATCWTVTPELVTMFLLKWS